MNLMPQYWPVYVSGLIYFGFLVLLGITTRMLPTTPKGQMLKTIVMIWVLLAALWLIFKPH